MKLSSTIFSIIGVCFAVSCNTIEQERPNNNSIPLTKAEEEINRVSNSFGFDLYHNLYSDNPVLISPLSFTMALAVIESGAKGQTSEEIQKAIGFHNMNKENVAAFYNNMLNMLPSLDDRVCIDIANSVWTSNKLAVKNSFISKVRSEFGSEHYSTDFTSDEAVAKINDWCSRKTRGKISKIVTELSPESKLAVFNTLYFNGSWGFNFDQTTSRADFKSIGGASKKMNMMHHTGRLEYSECSGYRMVKLPYGNGAYSMSVILPDNEDSFKESVLKFDFGTWMSLCDKKTEQLISLSIPDFSFEYDVKAAAILKTLGILDAFDSVSADFTGISDEEKLWISELHQKTSIDVNRNGTEIAAVTGAMILGATPMEFTVNRPFIFIISESSTGTILFIGHKTE